MKLGVMILGGIAFTLAGCSTFGHMGMRSAVSETGEECNAPKYAYLLRKPVPSLHDLGVPGNTRYYGRQEETLEVNPTRLNFKVSTTNVVDALRNEDAKIKRVFCG